MFKYSQLILCDSLCSSISSIFQARLWSLEEGLCFLFFCKIPLGLPCTFQCLVDAHQSLIWHLGKSLVVNLALHPVWSPLSSRRRRSVESILGQWYTRCPADGHRWRGLSCCRKRIDWKRFSVSISLGEEKWHRSFWVKRWPTVSLLYQRSQDLECCDKRGSWLTSTVGKGCPGVSCCTWGGRPPLHEEGLGPDHVAQACGHWCWQPGWPGHSLSLYTLC